MVSKVAGCRTSSPSRWDRSCPSPASPSCAASRSSRSDPTSGWWRATGSARWCSRDPRFSSNPAHARDFERVKDRLAFTDMEHVILTMDPPDHTRLRRLAARAFTSGTLAALEPWVRARTTALLDALDGSGEVDAVADFAEPLPIAVTRACSGSTAIPVSGGGGGRCSRGACPRSSSATRAAGTRTRPRSRSSRCWRPRSRSVAVPIMTTCWPSWCAPRTMVIASRPRSSSCSASRCSSPAS